MASPRSRTQLQARELRDLAHQVVVQVARNPLTEELKDRARALDSCIRAWECAADRERIAAGKPLPGSIRPEPRKRRERVPLVTQSAPVPEVESMTNSDDLHTGPATE